MSRLSGHLPFAFAVLCSTGTLCRVAPASTITFDLGPSAQNYTLTGTGGSGGYGTYNNTQGACSTASGLTTCDLTGAFTGNAAGLTGGTYDFQTTYAAGTPPFPCSPPRRALRVGLISTTSTTAISAHRST